jgi:hypothetical protein
MTGLELAGNDPVAHGLWTGRVLHQSFQFHARGGKPPVEPDLHGARTGGQRRIDGQQFLPGKAERLFDEHVAIRRQRRLHDRRVQVIAGGDNDCTGAGGFWAENRGVIRRGRGKSKLPLHMIRGERGVVHHRAQRKAILHVRQQHRPREVPRPNDIQPADRR